MVECISDEMFDQMIIKEGCSLYWIKFNIISV